MTTDLVLLGTAGGPTPKVGRSAPAQVVLVGGRSYVIDAGNGVARQLTRAAVPMSSLAGVFITHHHSDHVVDLGALLLLAWGANLEAAVPVFGPPPMAEMVRDALHVNRVDIDIRIADEGRADLRSLVRGHDIKPPDAGVHRVFDDDLVAVSAVRVQHPPFEVALAYRIDTADRSIVVSGDTAPCDAVVELARGADTLVHEVLHVPSVDAIVGRTTGSRLREHLLDSHTDVACVGRIAERAGVGTLVLSHFVPGDDSIEPAQWVRLAREGAPQFRGRIIAGEDLMRV